jgi:CRP-like cAMP-binding protein
MDAHAAIEMARASRWLARQTEAFSGALVASLEPRVVNRNDVLHTGGSPVSGMLFLAAGTVSVRIPHPALGEMTAYVMYPGQWLAELEAMSGRPPGCTARALAPAIVLELPAARIFEMIAAEPAFARPFFDLCHSAAEYMAMHAIDLLIPDGRQRLCARLLTLAGRRPGFAPDSPATIPMSQEEVGLTSGLSRTSANNFLRDLEREGLCRIGYREVTLLDVGTLAAIAFPQAEGLYKPATS